MNSGSVCICKFVCAIRLVCKNVCQFVRKCFCMSFVLIIKGQTLGEIVKCDWFRCGPQQVLFVGLEVVYTVT